jgi:hypothetical protein
MNRRARLGVILAAVICLAAVLIGRKPAAPSQPAAHGSAEALAGHTLIITIACGDPRYPWDLQEAADQATLRSIDDYLAIAAGYLREQSAAYGVEATFTTDFLAHDDLFYQLTADQPLSQSDGLDGILWEYIDGAIDSAALQQRYHADNVIYLALFNTDADSTAVTATRCWYDGMPYDYEIIYLYNVDYGLVNPPAVYAHEILHAFGAPDLYLPGSYGLDKDDVDYLARRQPNDIMLTCSDQTSGEYLYDRISNEVGELTAYYAGLTDHCDLTDTLQLAPSQHVSP